MQASVTPSIDMIKQIIALSSVGLLGLPVPATADDPRHPCATATQRCAGELQVPLNWADPDSERITVPFTWVPHTDRSRPSAGTIAELAGGPGPVTGTDARLARILGPLVAQYDLLVVERRGFGASSALRCPDIDLGKPDTMRACAEALGSRAQFFSTDQHVADVDAVRRALGVPSLLLHGYSYGTVDVLAYAARFPAATSAIVADSPLLPDRSGHMTGYTYREFLRDALTMVAEPCLASRACRAAHRDPAAEVSDLVRQLRADPDPRIPLSTVDNLLRFQSMLAFGRGTMAAIGAYLAGDRAPMHRLAALVGQLRGGRDEFMRANTAAMSYQCNDLALPYDRFAPPEERTRQLAEYRRTHPERPITAAEVGGNTEDFCLNWPTPRWAPPVPSHAALPDVPALIIGGSLDPVFGSNTVPLAKRFPRGQSVLVPFGQHSASIAGDPCLRDVVQAFVLEPNRRVRHDCTAEIYRALGRLPSTSQELPPTKVPGLAVAFATVTDTLAIARSARAGSEPQAGLRGGTFTVDNQQETRLNDIRYVTDVPVTGEIRLTDGNATATVTLGTGERIQLSWLPFQARDTVVVTGTANGRPFTARLPTTT